MKAGDPAKAREVSAVPLKHVPKGVRAVRFSSGSSKRGFTIFQPSTMPVVVERQGRLAAELYRRGKDESLWTVVAHEVELGRTGAWTTPVLVSVLRWASKIPASLEITNLGSLGRVCVSVVWLISRVS